MLKKIVTTIQSLCHLRTMLLLIAALSVPGCGYQQSGKSDETSSNTKGYKWKSLYREDVQTVSVPIFTTKDFRRGAEKYLYVSRPICMSQTVLAPIEKTLLQLKKYQIGWIRHQRQDYWRLGCLENYVENKMFNFGCSLLLWSQCLFPEKVE